MELDQTVSLIYNINDLTLQDTVTKSDLCTRTCFFSRLYKTLPDIIFAAFQKQDLDQRSCLFLVTIKTCRDNLGIIDHKAVSRFEIIFDLTENVMTGCTGFFIKNKQSGTGSVFKRILRDQLLRKIIIKITCFQCSYPLFLLSQLNTKFFQTGKNAVHCCCNFSFFQCLILCTEYDRISN